MNELWYHEITWTKLRNIMLNEKSKSQYKNILKFKNILKTKLYIFRHSYKYMWKKIDRSKKHMKSCNYNSARNGEENGIKEEHTGISVSGWASFQKCLFYLHALCIIYINKYTLFTCINILYILKKNWVFHKYWFLLKSYPQISCTTTNLFCH